MIGLTAVQEFVERGEGTPVPFDPPRRLVTTGIYAFVRNPMQVSAIVLLLLLGLFVENLWIAAAGVMAHIYSAGLAGWDEDEDLVDRFGDGWREYKKQVRRWFPRFRPWYPSETVVARLYVSESCGMCSQVGAWFVRQGARGLSILPAEHHPSGSLTRITYEPSAMAGRPRVSKRWPGLLNTSISAGLCSGSPFGSRFCDPGCSSSPMPRGPSRDG